MASRVRGFFRYNQDGGHRGRKASVASEKIRNTRFGTNRGWLPDFFMQPSRRRSLADVTARRYFVAKNQRTQKPQVIKNSIQIKPFPFYIVTMINWIFSVISLALPFLPIELQSCLTPFVWCGSFLCLIKNIMNMKKELVIGTMRVIRVLIKSLGDMERK